MTSKDTANTPGDQKPKRPPDSEEPTGRPEQGSRSDAEQAVVNEERALESGEEAPG